MAELGFTAHIRSRGQRGPRHQKEGQMQALALGGTQPQRDAPLPLVRWDRYPNHCITFLQFACARLAFRAAG